MGANTALNNHLVVPTTCQDKLVMLPVSSACWTSSACACSLIALRFHDGDSQETSEELDPPCAGRHATQLRHPAWELVVQHKSPPLRLASIPARFLQCNLLLIDCCSQSCSAFRNSRGHRHVVSRFCPEAAVAPGTKHSCHVI